MTSTGKAQPGIVGHLLIIAIFAMIAAPAFV